MRAQLTRVLLVATLVCLWLSFAAAQNYPGAGRTSIRGSVRDSQTHRAIYRVIVDVESQSGGNAGQVITDSTGKFDVEGLDAAVYLVRVRFPGYEEVLERVDLTVASSNYLDIQLKPKPGTAARPVAPEGPSARIDARLAAVPDKAKKEFEKGRECMEKAQDAQSCIDHLKKAVKEYPKFADAYVMMATAYAQQKDAANAKDSLERAIQADPKVPEAWFTLGMLQNALKDFAGAEKSLTEGLKLDDNAPQGHYELGKTYLAEGKIPEAEQHAQKAVALQPNNAPAHILLGNVAWKKQDAAGALKEYQEYLKLDPKGPMAPGAQAMVKKIQDYFAQPQNSPQ
jgi:cytochrome c-type biogenesis protein CcmH/NrfG